MPLNVEELRAQLPITNDSVYMNTGWSGPTPLPILQRVHETLKEEAQFGPASAKGLAYTRGITNEAKAAVGGLINAEPENVFITHSTTEGMYIVIHGLQWRQGDELLTCDLEHPALTVPSGVLKVRYGVKVVAPTVPPKSSQSAIVQIITSALTDKTKLVALSHVQFTCGLRMPIAAIAQACKERGVPFLVDGAQGAGHVAVDVQGLGCDFYTVSGQKWLMGPSGTGALYVNRDYHEKLQPVFTTKALEAECESTRDPLARFSLASQNSGLVAGFAEAIRLARGTSLPVTEARAVELARLLRELLEVIPGCSLLGPEEADSVSGLTAFSLAGWQSNELVATLQEQHHIIARDVHNPDGVRFSTAYFNTEEEVAQVASVLAELVR
jgi:L-cysteine/cystine lyase